MKLGKAYTPETSAPNRGITFSKICKAEIPAFGPVEVLNKNVGFSPNILLSILDNQSNMFKKNAGGIPLCSGVEIIKPS